MLDRIFPILFLVCGLTFAAVAGMLKFDECSEKLEAAFLPTIQQDTIRHLMVEAYLNGMMILGEADYCGSLSQDIEDRRHTTRVR